MQQSRGGKALNQFIRLVDRAHAILLTTLVAILATGVVVSVILRYFFGLSAAWSEELLTMSFVATTFFGASLCLREDEHISIAIVSESASALRKTISSILIRLIVIAVCAVVFRYSLLWIGKVGKVPSPATGIPNGFFYFIVPISFGFTIFYALIGILAEFIPVAPSSTKSVFIRADADEEHEESAV